eukprot:6807130-Prymnesium_polylepis.1
MEWFLAYRAGLVAVRARGFPWQFALGRRSWSIAQALWQFAHKGSRAWQFALGRGPGLSRRPCG